MQAARHQIIDSKGREMHPRTVATLNKLENAAWFSRVGIKDTNVAIVLSSWHEAIEHCSSLEWENLCLEARNQYCERLVQRSPKLWDKWNDIVVEMKRFTEPLIERKIETVVRENNLPRVFRATVRWDILGVCMESEYADVVPPGYYASQAYWYVKGHFPCGWQGNFPDGMLIIY
jgi:hypothetical protein